MLQASLNVRMSNVEAVKLLLVEGRPWALQVTSVSDKPTVAGRPREEIEGVLS